MKRHLAVLSLGLALFSFSSAADAACRKYTLSASRRVVHLTATWITNFGPGNISVNPPGIRMGPNDLFVGDPQYSYRVALVSGTTAKIEACM